jgi:hypothetical protein
LGELVAPSIATLHLAFQTLPLNRSSFPTVKNKNENKKENIFLAIIRLKHSRWLKAEVIIVETSSWQDI